MGGGGSFLGGEIVFLVDPDDVSAILFASYAVEAGNEGEQGGGTRKQRDTMCATDAAVQEAGQRTRTERIVNDFAIQVATVNGSGSQTANLVLLRSIFQMGVPCRRQEHVPVEHRRPADLVHHPRQRQGLHRPQEGSRLPGRHEPGDGQGRRPDAGAGRRGVYDEPLKLNELRSDLIFYPVPFDKLMQPITHDAKLRRLVRNMVYDGVLSKLLSIDMGQMEKALRKQMGKKQKAIELNMSALKAGYDYAEANLPKQDPFVVEPMDKTTGMILIEGNAAAAIGCMMAGVTFVGWYPITPSSSLCESLIDYLKKYRKDPETGKATYAVIQAEDELAALGMVLGAGWVGARAMTSTAGPGISLMSEFTGLGYYAEIPAVIFDVQRVGPSTGLPTRTGQQDILSTAVLSHGDTQASAAAARVGRRVLLDGDGGVRPRRADADAGVRDVGPRPGHEHLDVDPFDYPTKPIKRGKLLDADALKRLGEFARYRDVDGDGIPYRTVPGDGMPAYFTRGTGAQREGAIQRTRRGLLEEPRSAGAQVRDGAHAGAQARRRASGPRQGRHHRLRHDPLGHRRSTRSAVE